MTIVLVERNFVGIPKERVGASNDAKGSFGPPKFDDARRRAQDPDHSPATPAGFTLMRRGPADARMANSARLCVLDEARVLSKTRAATPLASRFLRSPNQFPRQVARSPSTILRS